MPRDALFGGKVALEQPARGTGYRVNVDAILLAAFAARGERVKVAYDLGAGAGGVALSLLHFDAAARVVLIEIDADAAAMAARNLEANAWSDRANVIVRDVRAIAREHAGTAKLVVCNPPYIEAGRGRAPHDPARKAARSGALQPFLEAARAIAGRRSRCCFVYPARESVTLMASLRALGLEPKRLRYVHAEEASPARVALVEAMAAKPGGLVVEPPLIERIGDRYSPELAKLLA